MHCKLIASSTVVLGACWLTGCAGGEKTLPPSPDTPQAQEEQLSNEAGVTVISSWLPEDFRRHQEDLLAKARAELGENPDDPDPLIWVGRRLGYLGRYEEAIEIYSQAIEQHPENAKILRHRGHRYISTRRFDLAVADLEHASELVQGQPDEIEPDGLPNARGLPTSTTHSNIWYHLGLAYYLRGELEEALRAYRACLEVSANPDMLSATSHWLYMTLRRLGRDEEAEVVLQPIHADMDIIENRDYHRLLLMYKGETPPERLLEEARAEGGIGAATVGYGVGNWYLYHSMGERALELFREVLASEQRSAFGFIAAETELSRLGSVDQQAATGSETSL